LSNRSKNCFEQAGDIMQKLKIAIIGTGNDGYLVYKTLKAIKNVEIVGVVTSDVKNHFVLSLRSEGLRVASSLEEVRRAEDIDLIIDTTENHKMQAGKGENKLPVVDKRFIDLIVEILKEKEELLEIKKLQGQLSAILNSVQEAIEVADKRGIINYVNPSFSRITGISEEERIGRNIFQESPNGALAMALKTGKAIRGHRTTVGGSNAEVISNASPIVVDGRMEGAVVVFQHITDIMRLMEELKKSTSIIENLSHKFGQVTSSKYTFKDILGKNKKFKKVIETARRAAKSNSTVILLGESGTGKELFAHSIHEASPRREMPFIKVNCAAIPETLLESELFGFEKGAFTGAVKSKIGKFELANGGTIFLDEIGDMNMNIQAKLLRVLQEKEFERIGGEKTIKVDVRVIAATNRNLRALVRKGQFRADLYYRLNVGEIMIPPLRERKEDLPLLIKHLIIKLNRKLGKKVQGISPEAEQILFEYEWPGNVRELENVLERVMVTCDEKIITPKHLTQHFKEELVTKDGKDCFKDVIPLDEMEEKMIKRAIEKYGMSVEGKKRAAKALNISLATLYNKLKKLQRNSKF